MSESLHHYFRNIEIEGKSLEKEIAENTEKYRKGNFKLVFPKEKQVQSVKVIQKSHAFSFGANTFMLESFDSHEQNEEYKEKFKKLFNLGVVGTFWADYEPQKGVYRFDKDSPYMRRRPPIDTAVEFCRENGMTVKAHNLIWHQASFHPSWTNSDKTQIMPDIYDYIAALADRYGDTFQIVDVANEHLCRGAIGRWGNGPMPKDYVRETFKKADKLFPNAKLMTNENHMACWVDFCLDSSPYYLYLKMLEASGCRVDAIGMQYHAFVSKVHEEYFGTAMMDIEQVDRMLKFYEIFERPIHISEITIPSTLFGEKVDEGFQREITENLVRLWFSRPYNEAIIWWNLLDGTAYQDEDKFQGALLRNDLSVKPVYTMLDNLINKEWHTEQTVTQINNNSCVFRGFYGDYDVELLCKDGTKETVQVTLNEDNMAVSL